MWACALVSLCLAGVAALQLRPGPECVRGAVEAVVGDELLLERVVVREVVQSVYEQVLFEPWAAGQLKGCVQAVLHLLAWVIGCL